MKSSAASNVVPDPKADNKILRNYFTSIVPNHDVERVYASDIKKIISWYAFLATLPLFDEEAPAANEETVSAS